MDNRLPDIDDLIRLAKEDPEGLEQLRHNLCQNLINSAPSHYQKRLNGIQFQIDMARQRSNNSLHSCIKISEMMLESYQRLQNALNDLAIEQLSNKVTPIKQDKADIIHFPRVVE